MSYKVIYKSSKPEKNYQTLFKYEEKFYGKIT